MWYRTSLILFAAGLTGCGALALNSNIEIAQRHDISTGDDTVEIRGSKKGAVERETCHIARPAFSMALIADAGQVSFIVGCSDVDIVIHAELDDWLHHCWEVLYYPLSHYTLREHAVGDKHTVLGANVRAHAMPSPARLRP